MYLEKEISMEYLAGSEELFQVVGASFKESYKNFEAELKQSLSQKDMDTAYNQVHSLKGITLNLGLKQLYDKCITVLTDFKEKRTDMEHINSLIEVFNGSYKELVSFLR